MAKHARGGSRGLGGSQSQVVITPPFSSSCQCSYFFRCLSSSIEQATALLCVLAVLVSRERMHLTHHPMARPEDPMLLLFRIPIYPSRGLVVSWWSIKCPLRPLWSHSHYFFIGSSPRVANYYRSYNSPVSTFIRTIPIPIAMRAYTTDRQHKGRWEPLDPRTKTRTDVRGFRFPKKRQPISASRPCVHLGRPGIVRARWQR